MGYLALADIDRLADADREAREEREGVTDADRKHLEEFAAQHGKQLQYTG